MKETMIKDLIHRTQEMILKIEIIKILIMI